MSVVKSEGSVSDGKQKSHQQPKNGQIFNLVKYRLMQDLQAAARHIANLPPLINLVVDGEIYQWTEYGYVSETGRYLTLEDLK